MRQIISGLVFLVVAAAPPAWAGASAERMLDARRAAPKAAARSVDEAPFATDQELLDAYLQANPDGLDAAALGEIEANPHKWEGYWKDADKLAAPKPFARPSDEDPEELAIQGRLRAKGMSALALAELAANGHKWSFDGEE